MYIVTLSTNDEKSKEETFVVTKAQYQRLEKAKNIGGFLRYHVSLYDDVTVRQRSQIVQALTFLASNVFYCKLDELQNMI